MRPAATKASSYQRPQLLEQASELAAYISSLSTAQLAETMHLSPTKSEQTQEVLRAWTERPGVQRPAIDAFLGDIYSGLQVQSFDSTDRAYANAHLLILSGLYGALRALDGIHPYRLEMGYKLPKKMYSNLYAFWGKKIAELVPTENTIINLSAVEYTKAVLPHVTNRVVTPKFLTLSPKSGVPTFVTVHAKVARGAFAHWLIQNRVESTAGLTDFIELNYRYNAPLSTVDEPVFICKQFGGIGLSVRLT